MTTEVTPEETKPTENTPTPEQDVQDTSDAWGDNFDAERAKKLVENLRADKSALKERLAAAEKRADEFEKRSADLEKRLLTSERDAAMSDILHKHPELEDWQDMLGGETLDEIRENAEKLAKRLANIRAPKPAEEAETPQDGDKPAEEETPAPEPASRPTPKAQLAPAHGGEASKPFDAKTIARNSRRVNN